MTRFFRTVPVLGVGLIFATMAAGLAQEHDSQTGQTPTLGLSVREDGTLLHQGRPFRAIGVNCYNAFLRHLEQPEDTSYEASFQGLAAAKIPFVRLAIGTFWPVGQRLYRENPQEYFRRLDDVVKAAERHEIGLIPSLFWCTAGVPDLVGEPVDQWGNPESKTHVYMRDFVRDLVTRYQDSPAIWGWEFGNEFNLAADLPAVAEHRPPLNPSLGTPAERSERDDLKSEAIWTACAAFAREVRKYDAHRIITSGNSAPRPSAWHLWKEKSWTLDTPEQWAEMLAASHPDPMNVLSIHAYAGPEEVLRSAEIARGLKKPLFVGEFGTSAAQPRQEFEAMLAALETAQVPLAALWVYDFPFQDADWNVTWSNERRYQLEAIRDANVRLRAAVESNGATERP